MCLICNCINEIFYISYIMPLLEINYNFTVLEYEKVISG